MKVAIDSKQVKWFLSTSWPSVDEGLLSISSNGLKGLTYKFLGVPIKETVCQAIERWSDRNIWYTVEGPAAEYQGQILMIKGVLL